MVTWQFATTEEFLPICDLFTSSEIGSKDFYEIERRIAIPLLLRQLITFYENNKLSGFVSFAFLNNDAEKHIPTVGILPDDWRSGKNFWVIDLVTKGDGYRMMRAAARGLKLKKWRYFRHKNQQIKELRAI